MITPYDEISVNARKYGIKNLNLIEKYLTKIFSMKIDELFPFEENLKEEFYYLFPFAKNSSLYETISKLSKMDSFSFRGIDLLIELFVKSKSNVCEIQFLFGFNINSYFDFMAQINTEKAINAKERLNCIYKNFYFKDLNEENTICDLFHAFHALAYIRWLPWGDINHYILQIENAYTLMGILLIDTSAIFAEFLEREDIICQTY